MMFCCHGDLSCSALCNAKSQEAEWILQLNSTHFSWLSVQLSTERFGFAEVKNFRDRQNIRPEKHETWNMCEVCTCRRRREITLSAAGVVESFWQIRFQNDFAFSAKSGDFFRLLLMTTFLPLVLFNQLTVKMIWTVSSVLTVHNQVGNICSCSLSVQIPTKCFIIKRVLTNGKDN